jgi:hypothetical protein
MFEDEHDFRVVAMQLRSGEAVSGKDHRRRQIDLVAIAAERIRLLPVFAATLERDEAGLAVRPVFNQRLRLQAALFSSGSSQGLGEARCDPLDSGITAGLR